MTIIKTIHFLNGQTRVYHSREIVYACAPSADAARARLERMLDAMHLYGLSLASPGPPTTWSREDMERGCCWFSGWREPIELVCVGGTEPVVYPSVLPKTSRVFERQTLIRYGLMRGLAIEEVINVLHELDPRGSYLEPEAVVDQSPKSAAATAALDSAAARLR